VVAMMLGALLLVRSPMTQAGVSLGVALGVTLPFAVIMMVSMRLVLRSRSWKPISGREQMIGASAEVAEPLLPLGDGQLYQGMVKIRGELWRAVSGESIPAGSKVRVARIEGLTLHVLPPDKGATAA
jgi:membrane-bound serine protease (ClpP class)